MALPATVDNTFFELGPNYQCRANKRSNRSRKMIKELDSHKPIIDDIPSGHYFGKFIGIYGRKLECYPRRRRRFCYQYLYVWNGQLAPLHPMDYEPVFVIVDDFENWKTVYYDYDHYHVGRMELPVNDSIQFSINSWWHSFRENDNAEIRDDSEPVQKLVDDRIWHWWDFEDNRAQLTIKKVLLSPLKLMNTDHFSGETSIIAEALYVMGLIYARAVGSTNRLSRALERFGQIVATLVSRSLRNRFPFFDFHTMLLSGSILLLHSLLRYNVIKLRLIPSFLERVPDIRGKRGVQQDKISNIKEIISRIKMEEFENAFESAAETDLSSNYMTDLKIGLEKDLYLTEKSKEFLGGFDV